jgi:two-component system, response regulator
VTGAGAGRLLLVDDDDDDVTFALRALARAGYADRVDVARDGAEALEYLVGGRAAAAPPRAVVLDLNLPRVGGLDVLARIRSDARTRTVPVIVVTSSDEPEDLRASYRLGANSYVRKRIGLDATAAALERIAVYWLTLNEPPPPTLP